MVSCYVSFLNETGEFVARYEDTLTTLEGVHVPVC